MSTVTTQNAIKQNIVVTRVIDAPAELVWKAWTEPERIRQWWGPKNYTSPSCELNFREGGKYFFACVRQKNRVVSITIQLAPIRGSS